MARLLAVLAAVVALGGVAGGDTKCSKWWNCPKTSSETTLDTTMSEYSWNQEITTSTEDLTEKITVKRSTDDEDGNATDENTIDYNTDDYGGTKIKSNQQFLRDIEISEAIMRAREWLLAQKNSESHWEEQTPRAIVALSLSVPQTYNKSAILEAGILERQFKLLLAGKFLSNNMTNLPPETQMLWINGLLATCSDPRDFFGKDLVSSLESTKRGDWTNLFLFLTLCNANSRMDWAHWVRLATRVFSETNSSPVTTESQAIALLFLRCLQKHHLNARHFFNHNHESERLAKLLESQQGDGSFGYLYTTAIALQALLAYKQEDSSTEFKERIELTREYLKKKQKPDGSFQDFLGTYLVLPSLAGRSMVELGNMSCTTISETVPLPKDRQISLRLEYDDISHSISLKVLSNSSVLDILNIAKAKDRTFRFEVVETGDTVHIYSICEKPNDPEKGLTWTASLAYSVYSGQKREETISHFENLAKYIPRSSYQAIIYRYKKT